MTGFCVFGKYRLRKMNPFAQEIRYFLQKPRGKGKIGSDVCKFYRVCRKIIQNIMLKAIDK